MAATDEFKRLLSDIIEANSPGNPKSEKLQLIIPAFFKNMRKRNVRLYKMFVMEQTDVVYNLMSCLTTVDKPLLVIPYYLQI